MSRNFTSIRIYNTLTRELENFSPVDPRRVGMYVCGPTVYGPAHLGHARSAITFDIVFRCLRYWGYDVKYVRNITDVGHLVGDGDEGEDKIGKFARIAAIDPMEVVQRYVHSYIMDMELLNVLPPSIVPFASGHITDQLNFVKRLLEMRFAYVANGSVYFDVNKYHSKHKYGMLSGNIVDSFLVGTREVRGVDEKRSPLDFALWKRAPVGHLMRWPSPWGEGFPGWHLECVAMSKKYLGPFFDIHGGGLDLCFPHHECELALGKSVDGSSLAHFWMHNNLIMVNGEKMSKSKGNFVSLEDCFRGNHLLLTRAYEPMVLRFFILQTHYRSTLAFTDDALQAARKAYYRLINGYRILQSLKLPVPSSTLVDEQVDKEVNALCCLCFEALADDFNTAKAIGHLFDLLRYIHKFADNSLSIECLSLDRLKSLKKIYTDLINPILGLYKEPQVNPTNFVSNVLKVYKRAKSAKDYETVTFLRKALKDIGVGVQDSATGVDWRYE